MKFLKNKILRNKKNCGIFLQGNDVPLQLLGSKKIDLKELKCSPDFQRKIEKLGTDKVKLKERRQENFSAKQSATNKKIKLESDETTSESRTEEIKRLKVLIKNLEEEKKLINTEEEKHKTREENIRKEITKSKCIVERGSLRNWVTNKTLKYLDLSKIKQKIGEKFKTKNEGIIERRDEAWKRVLKSSKFKALPKKEQEKYKRWREESIKTRDQITPVQNPQEALKKIKSGETYKNISPKAQKSFTEWYEKTIKSKLTPRQINEKLVQSEVLSLSPRERWELFMNEYKDGSRGINLYGIRGIENLSIGKLLAGNLENPFDHVTVGGVIYTRNDKEGIKYHHKKSGEYRDKKVGTYYDKNDNPLYIQSNMRIYIGRTEMDKISDKKKGDSVLEKTEENKEELDKYKEDLKKLNIKLAVFREELIQVVGEKKDEAFSMLYTPGENLSNQDLKEKLDDNFSSEKIKKLIKLREKNIEKIKKLFSDVGLIIKKQQLIDKKIYGKSHKKGSGERKHEADLAKINEKYKKKQKAEATGVERRKIDMEDVFDVTYEEVGDDKQKKVINSMDNTSLDYFIHNYRWSARDLFLKGGKTNGNRGNDIYTIDFKGNKYLEKNINLSQLLGPEDKYIKIISKNGESIYAYRTKTKQGQIGYMKTDGVFINMATSGMEFEIMKNPPIGYGPPRREDSERYAEYQKLESEYGKKIPKSEEEESYKEARDADFFRNQIILNLTKGDSIEKTLSHIKGNILNDKPELMDRIKIIFTDMQEIFLSIDKDSNLTSKEKIAKKNKIYGKTLSKLNQMLLGADLNKKEREGMRKVIRGFRKKAEIFLAEHLKTLNDEQENLLTGDIKDFIKDQIEDLAIGRPNFTPEKREKMSKEVIDNLRKLGDTKEKLSDEAVRGTIFEVFASAISGNFDEEKLSEIELIELDEFVKKYLNFNNRKLNAREIANEESASMQILIKKLEFPNGAEALRNMARKFIKDNPNHSENENFKRFINNQYRDEKGNPIFRKIVSILQKNEKIPKGSDAEKIVSSGKKASELENKENKSIKEERESNANTKKVVTDTRKTLETPQGHKTAQNYITAKIEGDKKSENTIIKGGGKMIKILGESANQGYVMTKNQEREFSKVYAQTVNNLTDENGKNKYFTQKEVHGATNFLKVINNPNLSDAEKNKALNDYKNLTQNMSQVELSFSLNSSEQRGYSILTDPDYQNLNKYEKIQIQSKIKSNTEIKGVTVADIENGEVIYSVENGSGTTLIREDKEGRKIPNNMKGETNKVMYSRNFGPAQILASIDDGNIFQDMKTVKINLKGTQTSVTSFEDLIYALYSPAPETALRDTNDLKSWKNLSFAMKGTDLKIMDIFQYFGDKADDGVENYSSKQMDEIATGNAKGSFKNFLKSCRTNGTANTKKRLNKITEWKINNPKNKS